MTTLPLTYDTAYEIKVSAKINGDFMPYGESCIVSTPAGAMTKLTNLYCGQIFPSYRTLYAGRVINAEEFTFEVVNDQTGEILEVVKPSNFFHLSNHTNPTLLAGGTSFTIRVKVKVNGGYGAYGDACVVTIGDMVMLNGTTNIATIDAVEAYPNPFTNQFTVRLVDLKPATIHVFDIQGRLVELVSTNETFETEMGQSLNAGIYVVRVEQNNETTSFKMIKK